jgi:hypothetical protein
LNFRFSWRVTALSAHSLVLSAHSLYSAAWARQCLDANIERPFRHDRIPRSC